MIRLGFYRVFAGFDCWRLTAVFDRNGYTEDPFRNKWSLVSSSTVARKVVSGRWVNMGIYGLCLYNPPEITLPRGEADAMTTKMKLKMK